MPYQIDPRIAAYVAELNQPGIPYVSRSHHTLSRIQSEHGEQVINDLLDAHWDAVRAGATHNDQGATT